MSEEIPTILEKPFAVRIADWTLDLELLRAIREEVFVREQKVPIELEWDDLDSTCAHVLAMAAEVAIGTGRLLPDGHIGRMAVLAPWRGLGVGSAMLTTLIDLARQRKLSRLELHAQEHAIGFYQRHGFATEGEKFDEAGIPHRRMVMNL
ncbi:MAG: GNAT family N-acetyltransferase [Burkholderiales bacterium]